MNNFKNLITTYFIIGVLCVLITYLAFRKPEKEVKLITIEVPEKTGSFLPLVLEDVEKVKDSIVYEDRIVYLENEVNKELTEKYLQAVKERDSLEQLNLYLSAIQIRTYNETFEDDHIKLSMELETTGYLNYITPEYVIKSYSLTAERTEDIKRSIYYGMTINNDLTLTNINILGNIGIKNKKEDLFILGVGTNKNITLTYLRTIFKY